jgi:membrane protease YdiL (CAAX protease family)
MCANSKGPTVSDDWLEQLWWTARAYAAVAAVAIAALIGIAVYLAAGKIRWLPLQRLRPGTWGGYEVFLAFCVVNGLPLLIVTTLFLMGFFASLLGLPPEDAPGPDLTVYRLRCLNVASPLILTATLGLIFVALYVRSRTRPHQYGLSWSRWPANLGLGLAAFILVTPVVLGLHAVATITQTEEHTLVALARAMQQWEWGILAFQVSIQAPLVEEILFRGILLGWLRRATLSGHLGVVAMTVFISLLLAPQALGTPSAWGYIGPGVFALLSAAGYAYLLYRLARSFALNETEIRQWQLEPVNFTLEGTGIASEEDVWQMRRLHREADERRRQDWAQQNAWLAVYGSTMLFAAFHTPAWPAPDALMLLAVALGWLAVRTQSLIGPITLHAVFNLVSFIVLYASTP